MNKDRIDQIKDAEITVSISEARRLTIQTDKLNDEKFKDFLEIQVAKKEEK